MRYVRDEAATFATGAFVVAGVGALAAVAVGVEVAPAGVEPLVITGVVVGVAVGARALGISDQGVGDIVDVATPSPTTAVGDGLSWDVVVAAGAATAASPVAVGVGVLVGVAASMTSTAAACATGAAAGGVAHAAVMPITSVQRVTS